MRYSIFCRNEQELENVWKTLQTKCHLTKASCEWSDDEIKGKFHYWVYIVVTIRPERNDYFHDTADVYHRFDNEVLAEEFLSKYCAGDKIIINN